MRLPAEPLTAQDVEEAARTLAAPLFDAWVELRLRAGLRQPFGRAEGRLGTWLQRFRPPSRPRVPNGDILLLVTSRNPGLRTFGPLLSHANEWGGRVVCLATEDAFGQQVGSSAALHMARLSQWGGFLGPVGRLRIASEARRLISESRHGKAFAPLAETWRLRVIMERILRHHAIAYDAIRQVRPKLVVALSFANGIERQFLNEARSQNIVTLSVQQGLVEPREIHFRQLHGDYFAAWGEATKTWLPAQDPPRVHVVGSGWIDSMKTAPAARAGVLFVDSVKTAERLEGATGIRKLLARWADAIRQLPMDLPVRVKLRPGYGSEDYHRQWPAEILQRVSFLPGQAAFIEAAQGSQVVVGGNSTASVEAVLAGTPVVIDGAIASSAPPLFAPLRLAVATDGEDLGKKIKLHVEHPFVPEPHELETLVAHRGRAAQTFAHLVATLASHPPRDASPDRPPATSS